MSCPAKALPISTRKFLTGTNSSSNSWPTARYLPLSLAKRPVVSLWNSRSPTVPTSVPIMNANRCSVSMPSAQTQVGSSAERLTTVARNVLARIGIHIPMVIGKIGKLRRSRPNPITGGNRRRASRTANPGSMRRLAQKIPGLTVPRLIGPFERKSEGFALAFKAMVDVPCATSAAAPACRCRSRADRFCLLARSAGVHVDFHADLHLDDFRSLPSHWGPPTSVGGGAHAEIKRKARPRATQVWNTTIKLGWADPTADISLLDKNHFSLGQSVARYPHRSGT